MMVLPEDVTIIRSKCVAPNGGVVVSICLSSLSAHFHIERVCPEGMPAYIVECEIKGQEYVATIFLPIGQTLREACAAYFSETIDVTKATIILGKYVNN